MKSKHYLFFLWALLYSMGCLAQDKPLFKEVATMYFSRYANPGFGPSYLVFMKKKDGWYTADRNASQFEVYEHIQLLWSAASRSWLPLDYPPAKDTSQKGIADAVSEYLGFFSDDFPVYNYEYDHCVYYADIPTGTGT